MMFHHVTERCAFVTKRLTHMVLTWCAVRTKKPIHGSNEPNLVRIKVQVRIVIHFNVPNAEVRSGIVITAGQDLSALSAWAFMRCSTLPSESLLRSTFP